MPRRDKGQLEQVSLLNQPAPPCVLVIFGGTGDLAARKIAPAIYNLARQKLLAEPTHVVGLARRPLGDGQFRSDMLRAIEEHSRSKPVDPGLWRDLAPRWHYQALHAEAKDEYHALARRLRELDAKHPTGGSRLFYLAMAPEAVRQAICNLGEAGLNSPGRKGGFVRVVVEKPFGQDLASARELNRCLLRSFKERQIYRMDHYLGKESVQNLMVLRFANAVFEPLFNGRYVDHVQITAAEDAGMEGRRGAYYEQAGALRDMVQSHLLQLLALMAMEAPSRMDAEAIRRQKVKALKAVAPLAEQEVAARTVRAQYAAAGQRPGYRQELLVSADSQVETYVALSLSVENRRWSGVPFYLRTGKALSAKSSHIVVVFKREAARTFRESCDVRGPNRLIIRIYPDEGISLTVDGKVPGMAGILRPVKLDFSYGSAFEAASPEAYEHLLLDAARGDPTLFLRDDEVEASWRVVDSIRASWNATGLPKLILYPAGSSGPEEADRLFGDPYKHWHPL
jgi:glucose-6-phosphate 1-dehydrogenase